MKIEIYGAEWCTYCKQAVKLCEAKGVEFVYVDIDESPNLKQLEERVGSKIRTVPQIFLDGNLVKDGYTGLRQELDKVK